jgi:malate dehydrogenase (oxaloacetate-decarboxylating)
LLPPLAELRTVSLHVAVAVAKQAVSEGLAQSIPDGDYEAIVRARMWQPLYATYRRKTASHA